MRLNRALNLTPELNFTFDAVEKFLTDLDNRSYLKRAIKSVTAAYTMDLSDFTILADATGAAFTVNLPPPVAAIGRIYNIKRMNSGANAVTLDGNGAETIDGAATQALAAQYASLTVQSNGTNWFIL